MPAILQPNEYVSVNLTDRNIQNIASASPWSCRFLADDTDRAFTVKEASGIGAITLRWHHTVRIYQ